MTPTFTAQIDVPPSTNNLYLHFFKDGRIIRVPTKEYKAWRKGMVDWLRAGVLVCGWRPPEPARIVITIGKTNRARDIDNFAKPVLDALVKAGAITKDNLTVVTGLTMRYEPTMQPGITVQVTGLAHVSGELFGADVVEALK